MSEAIQTNYSRYHDPAFEGQIADMQLSNTFSRLTDVEIEFGKVVVQGSKDTSVKIPTAGGVFRGISVRDQSTGAKSPNSFPSASMARILDKGPIWVRVASNVTAAQGAAFVDATGAIVATGTADSTDIAGAYFDGSAASGEMVILKLA